MSMTSSGRIYSEEDLLAVFDKGDKFCGLCLVQTYKITVFIELLYNLYSKNINLIFLYSKDCLFVIIIINSLLIVKYNMYKMHKT